MGSEISPVSPPPTGNVKVWTFIIRGGEPFQLKLTTKIGPSLVHVGGTSIWKMVGTEEEAQSVETLITGPTVGARVERHTEEEDAEMLKARFQGEF